VPTSSVTVVGVGADGWDGLAPASRAVVSAATVIIGSSRQLDLLPGEVSGRRVPLPSPLMPALTALLDRQDPSGIVVLASGDPLLYGIGSTLVRLLGADHVTVLPHPSSVSLAAARLGWSLDDLEVITTVGRPLALVHPALQPGRRLLVLVSEPTAAADIRQLVCDRGFGASRLTVLADLGGPDESVYPTGDIGDGAGPHSRLAIVAIECVADPATTLLPRTPGLPDETYNGGLGGGLGGLGPDGQLTKHEIRAIVLAALRPVPGQLLWDVGAGSGSVGIEWMRVHPASRAIAIEPRADRRERIAANASALGVPGLTIVAGAAPAALVDLPAPDAVFIGGGVTVDGVIAACWGALALGGRLVANAVTIESEHVLVSWQAKFGGTLTRISVERAGALGGFTTWRPALPVVQWSVGKPASRESE
jgi:precorrin-6B C5,15-methyltransferase / cobalt-precorrin-6B C5,C15-methyltransferase